MKHPCNRCWTPTREENLKQNPTNDDEFLCPRCLKRTEQAIRNWAKRRERLLLRRQEGR